MRSASHHPSRPCLIWRGGTVTYAEMAARAAALSRPHVRSFGIRYVHDVGGRRLPVLPLPGGVTEPVEFHHLKSGDRVVFGSLGRGVHTPAERATAGCFPDLRWSLFCGEPLPADTAQAWAEAADGSRVENLYGPTELTVACTSYRWQGDTSRAECVHGLVPIGEPFPGLEAIVVDSSLHEVPVGDDGELLVAGDQVSAGYWNDDVRTQAGYVTPPGRSGNVLPHRGRRAATQRHRPHLLSGTCRQPDQGARPPGRTAGDRSGSAGRVG